MIIAEAGHAFEAEIHGAPSGLVGTMGVRILDDGGNVVRARTTLGIIEKPTGSGIYSASLSVVNPGNYLVVWDSDPGGVASPGNSASEPLYATAVPILAPTVDPTGLPGGPCEPWITGHDLGIVAGISGETDQVLQGYANWASQLLFRWSASVFSGRCSRTVRPCRSDCSCFRDPGPGGGGVVGWEWQGGWWMGTSGAWYGSGGPSPYRCGCGCQTQVRLPYPTREVLDVRISGVSLDPATYRLDHRRWLTQLSTSADQWPACQDMSLPDGAPGTFEIDITYGSRPPLAGLQAAYALGKELYALSKTGSCSLPANTVQVIRQGVAQSTAQYLRKSKDGFVTGIPAVDAFLQAYNPRGVQRRPAVWSPDVQQVARRLGT